MAGSIFTTNRRVDYHNMKGRVPCRPFLSHYCLGSPQKKYTKDIQVVAFIIQKRSRNRPVSFLPYKKEFFSLRGVNPYRTNMLSNRSANLTNCILS